MIKAVIFDIGGTLVKTDKAILDATEKALLENGISLRDKNKVIHSFGKSTHFVIVTAVELSYCGADIDKKIDQCWNSFKQIFPKKVLKDFTVFSGITNTLKRLKNKGIKLAIFTGFNSDEAQFLLKNLSLTDYFDFIITKDDIKKVRPDPEALLLAIKKLGIDKDECIYVGDTIADIQMAKNANMKIVCVKTGIQDNELLRKENPDYFVKDTREMLRKLFSDISPN